MAKAESYFETPINITCTVRFDSGSGVTTLAGGSARIDAISLDGQDTRVSGTVTITPPATPCCPSF